MMWPKQRLNYITRIKVIRQIWEEIFKAAVICLRYAVCVSNNEHKTRKTLVPSTEASAF